MGAKPARLASAEANAALRECGCDMISALEGVASMVVVTAVGIIFECTQSLGIPTAFGPSRIISPGCALASTTVAALPPSLC